MSRIRIALALLVLLAVGTACSGPTEPRIPAPDEEAKNPPPDQQGFHVQSEPVRGGVLV